MALSDVLSLITSAVPFISCSTAMSMTPGVVGRLFLVSVGMLDLFYQ